MFAKKGFAYRTKKNGCHAYVEVKHYIVFLQFRVKDVGMKTKQLQTLKERKMKAWPM